MVVYIVVSQDFVHGVYALREHADIHARVYTGTSVIAAEIRDELPREIRDDIESDDPNATDFDGDTPVMDVDDLEDQKK